MKYLIRRVIFLAMLIACPTPGHAQLAGKFDDGKLLAEFSDASGGVYPGKLTLNGQTFAATAHVTDHGFEGTFATGADTFPFTAILTGDTLTLSTGGSTYNLKRLSVAKNPLGAASNPLVDSGKQDPLAGYTTEASTDFGKSLVTQKANVKSVQAALEATFPDLARYFGSRPEIGKAYEDARDHSSGGATFSSTLKDQKIKGVVSCKLTAAGATVAVIFDRADAGKADWDKLTSPPSPAQSDTQATDAPNLLGADARTYQFPDGTGTLTLAAGWKSEAPSAISPVFITGPADQTIAIGNIFNVQTPDSPLMKLIEHNEAIMRQMGGNPPARAPMLVADFTDPVQAMTDLGPQISKISESRGGPSGHLDKIISHEDAPCDLKDGKAAIISWDGTRTLNERTLELRGLGTIQMAPIVEGTWMYCFTGFTSPRTTFEQDKPLMLAMIKSEHVDAEMASQRMREQRDQQMAMLNQQADANAAQLQRNHDQFMHDQAQRFADGQARHAEQIAGYQRHNDQWKADELQKSRNAADFIETIKGTRTIYDTQTGATGTADLNYATGVVDSLNNAALDPNRFVQIPLRDEMYPVPAK